MIEQFVDFYKFVYNKVTFHLFCDIIQKPYTDCYAREKFELMKNDFGRFICDCQSLAEALYNYHIQTSLVPPSTRIVFSQDGKELSRQRSDEK